MINKKNGSKILAWNENLSKRCNHPLLPQGIRGLIISKSGYGKNHITNKPFTTSSLARL